MGKSDFLFATPSIWSGISRIFDLFGRFDVYNESRDGKTADERALRADLEALGQDLRTAITRFDAEPSRESSPPNPPRSDGPKAKKEAALSGVA